MTTTAFASAGLLRRLAAMVYDSLLIMSLSMLYGGIFITIKYGVLHAALAPGQRASIGLPGFIGMVLVVLAFFCYFWCRGGQTLGMKAWRLKLCDTAGNPVSLRQALIRCFTAPLSLTCLGLGYLWCLWDRDKKTWHDHISDTRVVLLPGQDRRR